MSEEIKAKMNEEEHLPEDAPALPQNAQAQAEEETFEAEPLPEWKVSGIFSSHMVLQRERPITVWGWSSHTGAQVTGCWDGETVTTEVDADGRFALTFAARPLSFVPSCMKISSAYGSDAFEDILVGDVWVIGGQSNAELNLAPCLGVTPEIAADLNGDLPIRLFRQTQGGAIACKRFHNTPSRDIIEPEWCWNRPDEENAKRFSALGYYFARLITEKIPVPMGVVMMCAGGACLRELMPQDLANRLGYTTGANVPVAGYFNTLIAPLIGLQFKGQIFFQGESEGIWKEMALSYDTDLAAFVEDERARFGFDFPFYNVQLSSYRDECDAYFKHLYWVRSRQLRAVDIIPRSYMAVARDLGSLPDDPDFAHSPYKYPLAKRVAAQVLAEEYGIGTLEEANAPIPVCAVKDGDTVTVRFSCAGAGLTTPNGDALCGFSFMNEAGEELAAQAAITGPDTVAVTLPEGADAAEVHFAMYNKVYLEEANLCRADGMPVPAFALAVQ